MPISFPNRRNEPYYIKAKKTKTGKTTYYLTKKKDESCLEEMPTGYEVFKNYEADMLYIRQKKESWFTAAEVDFLETTLRKHPLVADAALDVHGDTIRVYVISKQEYDEAMNMLKRFGLPPDKEKFLRQELRLYWEVLRVVAETSDDKRLISVQSRSRSTDEWFDIEWGTSYKEVIKGGVSHLGGQG